MLERGEQPPGDPFSLNPELDIAMFAIPSPPLPHLSQKPALLFPGHHAPRKSSPGMHVISCYYF